ncbi:unnamed protein product [Vitrella brassicaformis CCMP3155]|uniref:Uncharacterized protein n=3 Tax=Vitrella brassicaformis TaxID=1169539 RepID=A0A0G4EZ21_VITBC|nr:unnamed protein product [Vitrella brassicaformis CCMP3155]|eukprot:CEM04235.1 unnamed protein product [Vitrella brassicaformis CCMP3155]
MAAAAASSSSAAADLPQQQTLPSSHERYKKGTRVWMVTNKREKGKQEWVTAAMARTEDVGGATKVYMTEKEMVDGRREQLVVVVPDMAKTSPHGPQVHEGFTLVESAHRDQNDSNTGQQLRLFDLPSDVERDVFFPLLGPGGLSHLHSTCALGSRRVSVAYVKTQIDAELAAKGLKGIISYELASIGHLLRLLYIIQKSGEWEGWEPIIRVAKHQGRGGGKLPIYLDSGDVEGVGSRWVYDSRCEALRQLSLIGRHLGMALRRVKGEELLGGHPLTIPTRRRRDRFDRANPVCVYQDYEFASIRDVVLDNLRYGGTNVAFHNVVQQGHLTRCNRLRFKLHTTSTGHSVGQLMRQHEGRVIVLHGDQPDHSFKAHLHIIGLYPDSVFANLYTTERPAAGQSGAARFPQTVQLVRQQLGTDVQLLFGNQLVAVPSAGPATAAAAATPSSSAAAGVAE